MKYVLLNFGQFVGFDSTLNGAIQQLLASAANGGNATSTNPGGGTTTTAPSNTPLSTAIDQINKALSDLAAAQKANDYDKIGQAYQELGAAIAAYQKALAAQQKTSPTPTPNPSGSGSPAPSVPSSPGPSGG